LTAKQILLGILLGQTAKVILLLLVIWNDYREPFYLIVTLFSYFSIMNSLRGIHF